MTLVADNLRADARWRRWEVALAVALPASWWLLPGQALLASVLEKRFVELFGTIEVVFV